MVRYVLAGDMLGELSRNWWVVVLRGVAAVLFGLLALVWPGMTTVALAVVFGAFALVDGVALAFTAYRAAPGARTSLALQAGLGIILGLLALIWPMAAVIALVFLIGAWAVVTGVAEIVTAVRLRAQISSEWLLIFVGALSIIFGLLLWFWPLAGAEAIVLVVGIYAIVFGVVMAVAGFRLRGAADHIAPLEGHGPAAGAPDTGGEGAAGTGAAGAGGGDLLDTGEPDEEGGTRGVSAFDEGYAGGYTHGFRGDQSGTEEGRGAGDDETATPRSGRHRAPKDPREGTDTP
ncbi:HdeD family acid-resistance protein [Nocardiopsis terrae]